MKTSAFVCHEFVDCLRRGLVFFVRRRDRFEGVQKATFRVVESRNGKARKARLEVERRNDALLDKIAIVRIGTRNGFVPPNRIAKRVD